MTQASLLKFPCHFPIKIIGNNTESFYEAVYDCVLKHFPDTPPVALQIKKSQNANFIAITATVIAQNQATLDALYHELSAMPDMKMVL